MIGSRACEGGEEYSPGLSVASVVRVPIRLGKKFDPESFDLAAVNRALQKIGSESGRA